MSVPNRPRPYPRAADPAAVLAAFGRCLAEEEARLEPVTYDEIEAYVDGTADGGDLLLFEERLARDPALATAVADLAALRSELEIPDASGKVLPFRRPQVRRRLGWVAAAAAALLAAILLGPAPAGHRAPSVASDPGATPAARQAVFADGFEEGSPAAWSATANGG
jgi:anti-sigma factor RsiW